MWNTFSNKWNTAQTAQFFRGQRGKSMWLATSFPGRDKAGELAGKDCRQAGSPIFAVNCKLDQFGPFARPRLLGIEVEHILHAGDVLGVDLGDAPHVLLPRLEMVLGQASADG